MKFKANLQKVQPIKDIEITLTVEEAAEIRMALGAVCNRTNLGATTILYRSLANLDLPDPKLEWHTSTFSLVLDEAGQDRYPRHNSNPVKSKGGILP